jgi:lysozyme
MGIGKMKSLKQNIMQHEGHAKTPYIDVLIKRNPEKYGISRSELNTIEKHLDKLKLTFGYGFTFITEDESEAVLAIKIKKIIKSFEEAEPYMNKLPLSIQSILVEMSYQMGISGVLKFKNMWTALRAGDYKEAAKHGLDSSWYRQTPQRAKELMDRMALS